MDKQIVVDGQFVSERVSQVVAAIKSYSPDIDVEWIPPSERNPFQAAFRLVHNPTDGGAPYTIFHVKTEEEFDARVLKKLIMGDQRNGAVSISEIEASEEAAKRVAHQRWLDELEEQHEMAQAVLKSNKSTYKVRKDLVISDYKKGNQYAPPMKFGYEGKSKN